MLMKQVMQLNCNFTCEQKIVAEHLAMFLEA